jgi:uncharacterized membrane protein
VETPTLAIAEGMEASFVALASVAALAVEAMVVVIVAIGAFEAIRGVFRLIFAVGDSEGLRRAIWLRFAMWIVLALEFALAADIIRTAIAPTWDSIGKLGAIAAIRTLLNWFLVKDIERLSASREEGERPARAL